MLNAPSDLIAILKVFVDAIAVGMAMLLLLAYKFGNRNRFISLLLALIVLLGATIVAIASYQVWTSSRMNFEILVIQALGIVTMLLAIVLAGWLCRKRYGPRRFMLWLVLWTMVISLASIIAFFLISEGPSWEELIRRMREVLLVAMVFATCIYMLNLPFMILALVTPFFRGRLYAYFHLKSMPVSFSPGTAKPRAGDGEQKKLQ